MIRRFELKDIPQVLRIERTSFKNPYDISTFLYFWEAEPEGFLVAEMRGRVVGYVMASSRNGEGEILSISVMPEFRRKGIGRRLMERAIEYLRGKGVDRIGLEVREGNEEAIKFYEKLGFKRAYKIPKYYPDGEDGIRMIRCLNPHSVP
jgi:ribosomal-protein-alanine N-acetyltransferase